LPAFIALLRILVAVADTLAGLLVYLLVVRTSGDRLAGAIAGALYCLVPIGFQVQYTGNLTNGFGQSWFFAGLALISLGVVRRGHTRGILVLAMMATVAALSHGSTFAILVPTLLLVAVAFAWRGNPVLRTSAAPIVVALLIATFVVVLAYYGHFGGAYRQQASRIAAELGQPAADSDPGGRSVLDRLVAVPHDLVTCYGVPLMTLAAVGAAWLVRRRQRDRFGLTLAGWTAGCAAFLVLGVLTPVDMRHYFAYFPAVALLAGLGSGWLWRQGVPARVVAGALLGWTVARAVWEWIRPLSG
jgi:hypothetical protein